MKFKNQKLIAIINYFIVFVILFTILSDSFFIVIGWGDKPLPFALYGILFLFVGFLGFISLPLHINDNFKDTQLDDKALAWSISLTSIMLFGAFFFDIRYSKNHHSGFSDEDVLLGFASALFLVNSYFFVFSLVVRKRANLFIHIFDYFFGVAMLLTGFASTGFIFYLISKVA